MKRQFDSRTVEHSCNGVWEPMVKRMKRCTSRPRFRKIETLLLCLSARFLFFCVCLCVLRKTELMPSHKIIAPPEDQFFETHEQQWIKRIAYMFGKTRPPAPASLHHTITTHSRWL